MLQIENITYRIGPRVLFDGASASVPAGHRVGLVGRNGTGGGQRSVVVTLEE